MGIVQASVPCRITVLPVIYPDNIEFGEDYRQRTKSIRAYFLRLMNHSLCQ